ncbi:hypothetical protein EKL30_01320 [Candidimonas sp. SYP-B2681]|uniref:hypothetical protein n=1 Tax=Candidimonas sp. SYP-B2681 TaxID=2497686 RepID=UPI000F881592|nr:hypothetical protein [Candidimonas sp. SYP-B2681]RTZ47664.1 hypothetical protein EKL30_01320 [Candidimonas sp. SYP-B2681]
MFFTLLLGTFAIAALVSLLVVRIFSKPVSLILDRIIQDKISSAWSRYITFAAFVVGISGGVRVYELERYIAPVQKDIVPLMLTPERWVLEIYRTIIECLQSMAWMYLLVFVFALIAYVIVKASELKHRRHEAGEKISKS